MKGFALALVILFITYTFNVTAQDRLPLPRNVEKAFAKGTRSYTGKPGQNYWQNTSMYNIDVNVNPATRVITGTAQIEYSNKSPDTLKQLVFKLYPNLYKKGNVRLMGIDGDDANEGMVIESFEMNGKTLANNERRINGTNMLMRTQIAPKQKTSITIKYHYTLNEKSHIRQGMVDTGAYFIAYFFPRIAVYDDIDGWNMNPYLGTQEFYNDFCSFNINITVPENYLAWATGDLANCDEVLNPKYCQRLRQAERSNDFSYIVDSTDLKNGNITKPGNNTWKFIANNVTDVAFAISNHYLWQSTSVEVDKTSHRRTRVDAVFNQAHKDYYLVCSDARKTVESMSFAFPKWPFPFSHMTVFDGLDQMEYPMMANDNPVEDRAESIELTTHEIFHMMFPFYMGTNETKYGWMDEGWATIGEWLITPMIDSSIIDEYGMERTNREAGTENDLPIVPVLTTQLNGMPMFLNSYPKPALGYLYVKDMLGDELFFKGLHQYIRNWNGRHPQPTDFFYSMNEGSGKNLNWFWRKWFYENGVPDIAVKSFVQKGKSKVLTVERKGEKPVPVDAVITFDDGSSQTIHRSIAVWEKGAKTIIIPFSSAKNVVKVNLTHTYLADANKADNVWEAKK